MRNESPVGLATILGLVPAALAAAIFVVLLVMNGGDVDKAVALTIAIIGALSLVGTAGLRQWRAVVGVTSETTEPVPMEGGAGEPAV